MALNRVEVKAEVANKISPTITVAKHTDLLSNDLVDSAIFKKDVTESLTGVNGAVSLDFSLFDTYTITANGNITLTPINLAQGQVAKVEVGKTDVNFTIDWAGVNGTIDGPELGFNNLLYTVINTNGNILVIRTNRQYNGTLNVTNYSGQGDVVVTSVNYTDYQINDNMLFVQGRFQFYVDNPTEIGDIRLTGVRFGDFKRQNASIYFGAGGDVFAQMPLRAWIVDYGNYYEISLIRHDDSDIPTGTTFVVDYAFQTIIL